LYERFSIIDQDLRNTNSIQDWGTNVEAVLQLEEEITAGQLQAGKAHIEWRALEFQRNNLGENLFIQDLTLEIATRTGYIAEVQRQMDIIAPNLTATGTDSDVQIAIATAITAIGTDQMAMQQVEVDRLNKELTDRQTEFDARVELGKERIAIENLQFQASAPMNNAYVNEMIFRVWEERQMIILSEFEGQDEMLD
jgi:hypothetical protein